MGRLEVFMESSLTTGQNGANRVLRIASSEAFRIYGFMLRHKEFRVKDLALDLDLPLSTCYKVVNRMQELAAIDNLIYFNKLTNPKRYSLTEQGELFCENRREEFEVERALRG